MANGNLTRQIAESMSGKESAIFVIIVGLLLGTVFTFGDHFWLADISDGDAVPITAAFTEYRSTFRKNPELILRFSDHEQLYVDAECVTDELIAALDDLAPGTQVELLMHPNSHYIISLSANGKAILEAEWVRTQMKHERTGFLVLGVFMYFGAAYGVLRLAKELAGKKGR